MPSIRIISNFRKASCSKSAISSYIHIVTIISYIPDLVDVRQRERDRQRETERQRERGRHRDAETEESKIGPDC